MTTKSIALTNKIKVNEKSHILYFYHSSHIYLDNLISFILSAKELNQRVIYIDNLCNYDALSKEFGLDLEIMKENGSFEYINNYDFYEMYGDFHFERVLGNFKNTVQPYVDMNQSVRVWGHVDWREQENILEQLHTYECQCDLTVNEVGFMTVCAYDGRRVPSYILAEMMKSHEYFMTDTELIKSPLYNKTEETIFPSLNAQRKIESEMDLYKEKLDFVHVVAHEVRNPLTVIKSFATILKSETDDTNAQQRLSLIEDYAIAIDHEIHHIIQTEQMISLDTYWKKKLLTVLPTVDEVLDIMTAKARTQNITLLTSISIPSNLIISGNIMGLKLILSNLISNAIKYSYEGEEVLINGFVRNRELNLEIIDSGVGMTEIQMEKLFVKYQKMNEDISGQGIGLYMVNKLVHHFGGRIYVKSKVNEGTTIRVVFPT